MKKYIKIALISIVVLGIIGTLFFYLRTLGDGANAKIPVPKFENRVASLVQQNIKGKSYEAARAAFDSISICINTEEVISLANGEPAATESSIKHSRQYLFDGYAPIFVEHAAQYFNQSAWNASQLRDLQGQASALTDLGVAENGTQNIKQLATTMQTVKEYFAAIALASTAKRCTTVAAVQQFSRKVASYKHAPLTNCSSLMATLNAAPTQARNACAASLAARANSVCNYQRYSSYDSFYYACNAIKAQIKQFTGSLGNHPSLSSALSRLSAADSRAVDYFSNSYYSDSDSTAVA